MAQAIHATESDVRTPPKEKMTFDEFLEWCDEDTYAEWVDGEIVMASPVSNQHRDLSGFLGALLRVFVESRDLGLVGTAPFLIRLSALKRGREPDLFFLAKEHTSRIKPDFLDGPADLVIEIVSPESFARDRGDKFVEYEAAGVREYWLIDPQREQAEFYSLGADQRYHLVNVGGDGIFRSGVLAGFWLRVERLWQTPLPNVADVLREMKII